MMLRRFRNHLLKQSAKLTHRLKIIIRIVLLGLLICSVVVASQSLIDSNIQSSPSDGGNGNIGDEEPQITLEPNSGGTGTRVVVSGTGWQGGLDIAITFDGINVATANGADNNGEFTISFNVPGDATAGDHTVLAAQFLDFDCCQASATFTVTS